ncbi:hypothetical protein RNZ50_00535 [Paracoccaceae bacterium Fryx2]|nr:hypothetical protein [Paracoccaceae bacterium Fryx2]
MADQIAEDATDTADAKSDAGKVARLLVRALWQVEWSAANPDAKPGARKAAWQEVRESRAEHIKTARKALRILERRGVTLTVAPGTDVDADEE